jgi:hypothetical protein
MANEVITEEKLNQSLNDLINKLEAGTVDQYHVKQQAVTELGNHRTFAQGSAIQSVLCTWAEYLAKDLSGASVVEMVPQSGLMKQAARFGNPSLYKLTKEARDQEAQGGGGATAGSLMVAGIASPNGDILYTANDPGPGSALISVEHVVAGLSTPRTIVVTDKAIVVNVATDGGGAVAGTETAASIAAAVAANSDAAALVGTPVAQGTGLALVAAAAATNLSAGTDPLGTAGPVVYGIKRSINDTTPRAALVGGTWAAEIGLV